MKFWHKFVIISELFCIFIIDFKQCNDSAKDKYCDVGKFEDSIQLMFSSLADKNERWPENEKEMAIWCKSTLRAHKYVKNYSDNCLKGLSKPTISVLAYHAGKTNKYFCKNKQERKRFIDKGVCANQGKDGSIKCWNQVLSIVENVKNVKDPKEKLPSLCCCFYFLNDCVFDVYKKLYPRYCSADNLEHVEQHLNKIAMESFKSICSEYEDRDKCANYMDKLDRYGKTEVIQRYKTPFPGMFEILETI